MVKLVHLLTVLLFLQMSLGVIDIINDLPVERHVSVVSSINAVLLEDLLWRDEVSLAHVLAVDV